MKKRLNGTKVLLTSTMMLSIAMFPVSQFPTAFAATSTQVALTANSPSAANHGKLKGHIQADQILHLTLALNLQNQDKLNGYLSSLYDSKSANYHQFLTPQKFGELFGATKDNISQVVQFVKNNGLSVDKISPENTFIQISGPAFKVEKAFSTTINDYNSTDGKVFYANANTPAIPATIAPLVSNIVGLDNEHHWHRNTAIRHKAIPATGSGPSGGYTPTQLRSAYDVSPLISIGIDGSGQNVALFELDGFIQSNISTYDNQYSLGSPTPTTTLVDGYNGSAGQGEGEVELDIEVIHAIAPKAHINVYEGPNTDQGVIDTYQKIASDNLAKSVSTSWGESELQSSTATMQSMDTIFKQMAAQGQSVFAASGDSGAYDGGNHQLAVDSPANDPYVTGVGGTHLTLTSTGGYSSESVWANQSTSPPQGGGGGISTIYSKPSWQTGTGTTNSYSNGMREVPDVSADADPSTGYSIYSSGAWQVYGGTSAAAPFWAAVTALNNQYATNNGKTSLGQANPALYSVFNSTQAFPAFHDINSGNNLYYPATSGYDMASGIGTPDVYNLLRDINGASSGGGGGTTSSQLISNGGFESGAAPWVESSSGGYELVDPTKPHTGGYSAYFGGYGYAKDTLYQTIAIPANANSVTFTYWTDVEASGNNASDKLTIQVRNTSNSVLSTLKTFGDSTSSGWTKNTVDLSTYKGKSIELYFMGTNGSSGTTSFFVDDVSVVSQ